MIRRKLEYTFSLLNVDHVNLDSRWNYRNVISPYSRIYYIDQGEGQLFGAEGPIDLEPGYLYLIPSFTLFSMSCPHKLGQYFVQFFENATDGISLFFHHRSISKIKAAEIDLLLFRRLVEINPGRGINRSDNPKVYEKDIFYKEYQELNNRQNESFAMETQGVLWQLTAKFIQSAISVNPENKIVPIKLAETLEYIQMNLQEELTVSNLASRLNQNPDYFSRKFKCYTGTRPLHFINNKRVQRAQHLMATTMLSYSEIARETGFQDLAYFSRTFKKMTSMSPSDYRKQMHLHPQ